MMPGLFHIFNFLVNLLAFTDLVTAAVSRTQHFNYSSHHWNEEFRSGKWAYIDRVPVERARSSVITGVFINMNFPNGSILDVGCGEGTLSDYINENQKPRYLGIDLSREAVRLARTKRPGLRFKSTDAETFIPRQKFDVVVFNEVLYYLNHKAVLMHYAQFLSPNGILVVSVFHRSNIQVFEKTIFSDASSLGYASLGAIKVTGQTPKRENPGASWEMSFHIEAFRPGGKEGGATISVSK